MRGVESDGLDGLDEVDESTEILLLEPRRRRVGLEVVEEWSGVEDGGWKLL